MVNQDRHPVYPLDVYIATEAGEAEVRAGTTTLPPAELELLVKLDGRTNVGDLEQRTPHIDSFALREAIRQLFTRGLLRRATVAEELNLDLDFARLLGPASPSAEANGRQEAQSGSPALDRDGYYVSIARKSVTTRSPVPGQKLQVLVVEDDEMLQKLLVRLLEASGYAVRAAGDRATIVDALRQLPSPDLVLLDIMLPDTNGFDVLARMKAHPTLRTIPVILLTAKAERESVARGLAGGADGYITKPFQPRVLIKGIRAVLGLE